MDEGSAAVSAAVAPLGAATTTEADRSADRPEDLAGLSATLTVKELAGASLRVTGTRVVLEVAEGALEETP